MDKKEFTASNFIPEKLLGKFSKCQFLFCFFLVSVTKQTLENVFLLALVNDHIYLLRTLVSKSNVTLVQPLRLKNW